MSQRTGGIRRPLANANLYSFVQRALGAGHVRDTFVREHLQPSAGERILDLGCGPGDILELLPSVEYLGVDQSAAYVEAATARFGGRARFVCADIRELTPDQIDRFDAVISIGVLHHLDDEDAAAIDELAAAVLDAGGRMITIDPAFADGQARSARWLISRDRGRSVRTAEGYRTLAEPHFSSVSASVRHDLARVPYTHAIVECRGPLDEQSAG